MWSENAHVVEGQIEFATLKNVGTGAHSPYVGRTSNAGVFLEVT